MVQDRGQYTGEVNAEGGPAAVAPGAFDGYDVTDVPLGDLMRGERATLGKSLLDVERELKIRAAYIAAIENGDVGAFASPGFIAGYVRSYARYLGMDPDWTFRRFCIETGFQGVHGATAQQAQAAKRSFAEAPRRLDPNEVIGAARISFTPSRESFLSGIEPGALGSAAVLLALVMGLGYGAWAVLHDIQRLQIAPVEEAPVPLAQLDPLAGATGGGAFDVAQDFDIAVPSADRLDRLYRPEALDVPVLTPRDGALATLDPDEVGTLGGFESAPDRNPPQLAGLPGATALAPAGSDVATAAPVQVTAAQGDELVIFAVRPSWIRVSSASGATLFEGTLNRGDSYTVPEAEAAPRLRSGNAGSIFFAVNGVTFGPAGPGATIARDIELSADAITADYAMADAATDPDLPEVAALVLSAGTE
jgi:hypothetical protein